MNLLLRYVRMWLFFARVELQVQFATKLSALLFFAGKLFRFFTFFFFLLVLKERTQSLAGYTIDQVIIFFFTFNVIDLLSQILFRGVYMFSARVRTGEFDYYLAKPLNPLFRALGSHPDFNDVILFFPLVGFFIWYVLQAGFAIPSVQLIAYLVLLVNGILIASAFHIIVLCIGVVTTEVDHAIMIYRDISTLGRFPIAIYREPFRWIATFVVPVGIMMSFPARVLLGEQSPLFFVVAFGIGIGAIAVALMAWNASLKKYTSASS